MINSENTKCVHCVNNGSQPCSFCKFIPKEEVEKIKKSKQISAICTANDFWYECCTCKHDRLIDYVEVCGDCVGSDKYEYAEVCGTCKYFVSFALKNGVYIDYCTRKFKRLSNMGMEPFKSKCEEWTLDDQQREY